MNDYNASVSQYCGGVHWERARNNISYLSAFINWIENCIIRSAFRECNRYFLETSATCQQYESENLNVFEKWILPGNKWNFKHAVWKSVIETHEWQRMPSLLPARKWFDRSTVASNRSVTLHLHRNLLWQTNGTVNGFCVSTIWTWKHEL